ncbi:MAG: hypothetical protein M1820_003247 [Bogoriella megaspora]|nr:MAG: hypothetical protein M1820_003247 [Bogoriella megaspora]
MPASDSKQKKKTLLLVFIHGFKGTDHTFHDFPERLRALLNNALPTINVAALRYPQYETKGQLQECVSQFKEWLQNKVIDLEVDNGAPSPTIDPSVRVVLVGHSMGGIVAAEALFSIANDQPVPHYSSLDNSTSSTTSVNNTTSSQPSTPGPAPNGTQANTTSSTPKPQTLPTFLFPSILGILAFDTPYLGVSPGVIAHGAEGHWNTLSSAYSAYNSATSFFSRKGSSSNTTSGTSTPTNASSSFISKALPTSMGGSVSDSAAKEATSMSINDKDVDVATTPLWNKWGRYAMFAGAAGAVAAGAAGAMYLKRNELNEGVGWAISHLDFVGCLTKGEDLQSRVRRMCEVSTSPGQEPGKEGSEGKIGWANLYTTLGKAVEGQKLDMSSGKDLGTEGLAVGGQRTFVIVPRERSVARRFWIKCTNDRAQDEIGAHTSMFQGEQNPGYYSMSERAKKIVLAWCMGEWCMDGDAPGEGANTPMREGTPTAAGAEKSRGLGYSSGEDEFETINEEDWQ